MLRLTFLFVLLGLAHGAPNQKSPGIDERIVGGHNTTIDLHPWQVSLQHKHEHFCGAVLIAPNWVLTAAHCIYEGFRSNLTIRAGSANRSSSGQIIAVTKLIVNEGGDAPFDNDVAVLQLAAPVTIATAKVATLPAAGAPISDNATVTVTGWGRLLQDVESLPEILQEVQVPVISLAECRKHYGDVTDNMFCAGFLGQGGKDACSHDSGGPATIDNVIVGLVSWGWGCALPDYPGVYAKVSNFIDWIKEQTGI